MAIVDFFDAGRDAKFGRLQEAYEMPILPLHGFPSEASLRPNKV